MRWSRTDLEPKEPPVLFEMSGSLAEPLDRYEALRPIRSVVLAVFLSSALLALSVSHCIEVGKRVGSVQVDAVGHLENVQMTTASLARFGAGQAATVFMHALRERERIA